MKEFEEREGIKLTQDIQALQRLTEAAEKAKMELSTVEKTTIHLPFIQTDKYDIPTPEHSDQRPMPITQDESYDANIDNGIPKKIQHK